MDTTTRRSGDDARGSHAGSRRTSARRLARGGAAALVAGPVLGALVLMPGTASAATRSAAPAGLPLPGIPVLGTLTNTLTTTVTGVTQTVTGTVGAVTTTVGGVLPPLPLPSVVPLPLPGTISVPPPTPPIPLPPVPPVAPAPGPVPSPSTGGGAPGGGSTGGGSTGGGAAVPPAAGGQGAGTTAPGATAPMGTTPAAGTTTWSGAGSALLTNSVGTSAYSFPSGLALSTGTGLFASLPDVSPLLAADPIGGVLHSAPAPLTADALPDPLGVLRTAGGSAVSRAAHGAIPAFLTCLAAGAIALVGGGAVAFARDTAARRRLA
ncbi:MAG: hypothetical protein JWM48_26 [Mycobacterium sp.]|nr:hypothetical protein [Mycobacterium sp.]